MNYSKKDSIKKDLNYYYVDLNIIYAFFDYLCPIKIDKKRRRERLSEFISNKEKVKFIISKTVYIEWFQKIIRFYLNKNKINFNSFTKTPKYKDIINKFEKIHKRITNKNSIFEFEWEFSKFLRPINQTWDHFHESFKERKDVQFISFDKNFTKNDFIYLDRNKK